MTPLHIDEAWDRSLAEALAWLESEPDFAGTVFLVHNAVARIQLASTEDSRLAALDERLSRLLGDWYMGHLPLTSDDPVLRVLSSTARQVSEDGRLLLADRPREHESWFTQPEEPPWEPSGADPFIVLFYGFKGGLGRSTLLASFALHRAREGDRVVVLDCDFEAPGLSAMFQRDPAPAWGVVDYLVDSKVIEAPPLGDYYSRFHSAGIEGEGEVLVFPAGRLDANYPRKLARIDNTGAGSQASLRRFLAQINDELKPRWILLDARTGLSDVAGLLLSGVAHLNVLLGSTSAQSWDGLRLIVRRLGAERLRGAGRQADIVLVQAMIPPGQGIEERFAAQAEDVFRDEFYASSSMDDAWDINDLETEDAPHRAFTLNYNPMLAFFDGLDEVAEILLDSQFSAVHARIETMCDPSRAEE